MPPESLWMTRKDAAAYLQVNVRTLERWAQMGGGPPYHVLRSRLVRYRTDEVDRWAQRCTRLHTADDGTAAEMLAEAQRLTRGTP